jgi:5'-deoxynucleotidase YfbR-like HD superfamily hydrolase
MSLCDYLESREDSFVLRWHARQTTRQETLAEHHFFVARDVRAIAAMLRHLCIAQPDIAVCVDMALLHDEPEKLTGDVSGQVKRDYPEIKKHLNGIEEDMIKGPLYADLPPRVAADYITANMRILHPAPDDLEAQIVKYADKVEAYMFALTEVRVGNTLMQEVLGLLKVELAELDWPWLVILREITHVP